MIVNADVSVDGGKRPRSPAVVPPVAWLPVGSAIAACSVALLATGARYGYHRDELYFRMLEPAWGYVDQPPLTPMLARGAAALFGDTVWGMRIPAVLCVAIAILLTALTTRELGGRGWAQGLSAWGFGFAGLPLVAGHVLLTATVDLAVWAGVLLFVLRALRRGEPRWWLAAGVLVGLGLFNKNLIVLLLIGLAVGLLAIGPRSAFRSGWLWAGAALAVVLASPNLIYQTTHDWPQITMAGALSDTKGGETRALLLPFQLLLMGAPLMPIWVSGFVALLRRPEWRPLRALAIAYPVVVVVTLVSGGQVYYPLGLLAFLFAAGCVPTADWIARRSSRRRPLVVAAVVLNAAVSAAIALPLVPVDVLGRTPIPEINEAARDSVGWPTYVRTLADVDQGLSAAEPARVVVYASNYGEAGAVDRYGPAYGLPAVYSAHNQLWFAGPPPQTATIVVAWTQNLAGLSRYFGACEQRAVMDNGVGVDNEEQGSVVAVCRDPIGGWATIWPQLQHYS